MSRKRVIYQSEALFTTAIGNHANLDAADQLLRVQDISHGVELDKQDVNEFGQLEAVERKVINPPTVSLDFSYYLHGGRNERLLNFAMTTDRSSPDASGLENAIQNFLTNDDGQNYYISVAAEGEDAKDKSGSNLQGVIGIGNGYITSYSVEAAVGDMPSASVSVEASNIEFSTDGENVSNPAFNLETGEPVDPNNTSPIVNFPAAADTGTKDAVSDWEYACLRPGDVIVDFNDDGNCFPSSSEEDGTSIGGAKLEGDGQCHLQNFTLDVPLSREALTRLGSVHPYSREVETPINITLSISAFLGDIAAGSLDDILCDTSTRNIRIKMLEPCPEGGTRRIAQEFLLKGASLDSQNFSASIGDNKTVDLVFTAQSGGANSTTAGLFMWSSVGAGADEGTGATGFEFSETTGAIENPIGEE